jgi:hypothetical protein
LPAAAAAALTDAENIRWWPARRTRLRPLRLEFMPARRLVADNHRGDFHAHFFAVHARPATSF